MNYFDDYFASLKHYVDAGKVQTFEGTSVIVRELLQQCIQGIRPEAPFTR
jgi:hypothetical protein